MPPAQPPSTARRTATSRLFNIRLQHDTEARITAVVDELRAAGVKISLTEALHALMDDTDADELRRRLRSYRERRSAL